MNTDANTNTNKTIKSLQVTQGTNAKVKLLKENKSELLEQVLKLTYDKLITFGYKPQALESYEFTNELTTQDVVEMLLNKDKMLLTRDEIHNIINKSNDVVHGIINRNLKIDLGTANINKVFPKLIEKPKYQRCDKYTLKTAKNINYPAFVQLKADGTYREYISGSGSRSRSGQSYSYDFDFGLPEGSVLMGELTVKKNNEYLDRSTSNGLLNSLNVPTVEEGLTFEVWDLLTADEYNGGDCRTYKERFDNLVKVAKDIKGLDVIETLVVQNQDEALTFVKDKLSKGLEGGVLKDYSAKFKDGTSKLTLKMKLVFDIDVKITGFSEGSAGTKREGKVGALLYSTQDEKVKGKVSGFTDDVMDAFTENDIGRIITIEGNDMTQAKGSSTFAISHPRFIEFRDDKTEADVLDDCYKALEMGRLI